MKTVNQKIHSIINIVGIVLMGASFLLLILMILQLSGSNLVRNLNISFNWTFIILLLAIASALVNPIINLFASKKTFIRSIIFFVAIAIVIFVSFALAKTNPDTVNFSPKPANFSKVVHLTEAGLILMYFVFILTILGLAFSEVKKMFK